MTDLRQQLLQAGLVTPAQAKQAEQAAGPDRPAGSGRGARRPPSSREPARPASAAERAEAERLARAAKRDISPRGHKRWYYVSREGLVPFVAVDDKAAGRLIKGDLAVVEDPAGAAWIVDRAAAADIAALDPTWIRCWASRG